MAWERLKHAFAIGSKEKEPLTPKQEEMLDRLAKAIQKRRLTPAAGAFLELSRPLTYIGSQGLHFLEPIATSIFSAEEYREFSSFLERRDAVDLFCARLDALESGTDSENPLPSEAADSPASRRSPD